MRSIITSLLLALSFCATAYAQINPATQIAWPTGAAGCVYAPATNACISAGAGGSGLAVCSDTSGSATAQNCTTSPSFTPTANASCILYSTTTTNSGAALTINVNSLGAKSVAIAGSGGWTPTLVASVVPAGKPLIACYDGTDWDIAQTGTQSGAGGFQFSTLPAPPAYSGFTQVNVQSGSTISQGASGAILFAIGAQNSLNWQILEVATPATPWSAQIYTKQKQTGYNGSSSWPAFNNTSTSGLYLYDGTKLLGFEDLDLPSGYGLRVERVTNVTTDGSTVAGVDVSFLAVSQSGYYRRWCDDGTTLYAETSLDGHSWDLFYNEPVGTFITPNAVGFGGLFDSSGGPGPLQLLAVQGWQISTGVTCP